MNFDLFGAMTKLREKFGDRAILSARTHQDEGITVRIEAWNMGRHRSYTLEVYIYPMEIEEGLAEDLLKAWFDNALDVVKRNLEEADA